ncbi:MAG TPA: ABC transporter substrate-binding protein [Rhodospirillaceae bacterium]|nr:ABC transporter substrate-binding protein [Rhodospirillaceae bacterium]
MTKFKIFAAFFLAALCSGLPPARAADPIRIGAIEDLSGPTARYGTRIREGFDLAAQEINAKGGILKGRPLEILYEDAAGTKDQAINGAKKLLARDKVSLLLGPTLSNQMFAVGPVAVERRVPIIGTSNTADGITDIGEWVFRTSLPEADVIPVTLRKAQAKFNIKKVALMYANDDAFSKSGFEVFKVALEQAGIAIVTIESFGSKDTDFSAQLTKIKGLAIDAICVSALVEPASGVVLQARQLGIPQSIPIIGGNGFNSSKLAEIAGPAAEGVMVGSPWFIAKPQTENVTFVNAFRKKYEHDPDQFAAQAYDTLWIVAEAFERAGGTDNEKLREALLKTEHAGIMGLFRFTDHRDPASVTGVVVLSIKNGKFAVFE